ncbi:hypothetical protein BEST7613_3219 [Bacillus subtilis BEST7613]|nr:hypothetical protein BEST7613_3219 [Bacillus subtilis BEST7613]
MPKPIKSSDRIKNGSNDGNTTSHHIDSPVLEASNEACGCEMTVAVKKRKNEAIKSVLIFDKFILTSPMLKMPNDMYIMIK